VEAGLRDLLKFFLLWPVPYEAPPGAGGGGAAGAAVPAQAAPKEKVKPEDILKKGFKFYTSDAWGQTDPIDLTDTQVYTDNQLDLLFKGKQKEIEKITFINHTGYCVDVTIIQGRDLTPCDEDDAAPCPPQSSAAK
jgi:hypothetical protein